MSVLLSIANLTWPMVLDADGEVGRTIALHDSAAKKAGGSMISLASVRSWRPLWLPALAAVAQKSNQLFCLD
jgi:hypothetical protein